MTIGLGVLKSRFLLVNLVDFRVLGVFWPVVVTYVVKFFAIYVSKQNHSLEIFSALFLWMFSF